MKPERPEPEEHWQNRQADEQHNQEESFISSNLPVISSVCECVYEYNDDHYGLLLWQCPKCEREEKQTDL